MVNNFIVFRIHGIDQHLCKKEPVNDRYHVLVSIPLSIICIFYIESTRVKRGMHKLKGNTDADPNPAIIKNLKHSIFILDTHQAGNIAGLKKKKSLFYLSLGILIGREIASFSFI